MGGEADELRRLFESVEQSGRTDRGDCVPYENHNPVFVCRGSKVSFAEIWPRLKHYD